MRGVNFQEKAKARGGPSGLEGQVVGLQDASGRHYLADAKTWAPLPASGDKRPRSE